MSTNHCHYSLLLQFVFHSLHRFCVPSSSSKGKDSSSSSDYTFHNSFSGKYPAVQILCSPCYFVLVQVLARFTWVYVNFLNFLYIVNCEVADCWTKLCLPHLLCSFCSSSWNLQLAAHFLQVAVDQSPK